MAGDLAISSAKVQRFGKELLSNGGIELTNVKTYERERVLVFQAVKPPQDAGGVFPLVYLRAGDNRGVDVV